MDDPKKICKDCGSDEVFVECNYPNVDGSLYQCFDCYCEEYENYILIDNNDDEDYL